MQIWSTESSEDWVSCTAWRPDGKVLAVAYKSGRLALFDVQSSTPVMSNQVGCRITFIRWTTCANSTPYHKVKERKESEQNNDSWDFLIEFPSLSKAFSYNPSTQEDIQACHKLSAETNPSILIIGTEAGQVYFFFSGYLAMGKIKLEQIFESDNDEAASGDVKEVLLSPTNLSTLSVISAGSSSSSIYFIHCPLVSSCFSELCSLSSKQSILQGTMDYMSDTLKQIGNVQLKIHFKMPVN